MLHVLANRAYVEVLLLIVEHVRLMERIIQELTLHPRVEHFILDKRGYLIGYHIFIVHLTAIAGVGADCRKQHEILGARNNDSTLAARIVNLIL